MSTVRDRIRKLSKLMLRGNHSSSGTYKLNNPRIKHAHHPSRYENTPQLSHIAQTFMTAITTSSWEAFQVLLAHNISCGVGKCKDMGKHPRGKMRPFLAFASRNTLTFAYQTPRRDLRQGLVGPGKMPRGRAEDRPIGSASPEWFTTSASKKLLSPGRKWMDQSLLRAKRLA